MLPIELVSRISAYQERTEVPTETDAVKRLLNDALKLHDDPGSLALQFTERLRAMGIFADAAREVLVGHPLISSLTIESSRIEFRMPRDGVKVIIDNMKGVISYEDERGEKGRLISYNPPQPHLDAKARKSNKRP